ncbi:MAG: Holliday junction resolvase RuvX [Gemmatimonadota bacterium]
MGVDYGERRIGLALSDPTATIASPLPTVKRRRGKRPPVEALSRLAEEREAVEIVVGLPLALDGSESPWTLEVRRFGERLAERTGLPVFWIDERLTSVEAERAVRSVGLPKSRREEKGRVDAAAATLILQRHLDRRGRA